MNVGIWNILEWHVSLREISKPLFETKNLIADKYELIVDVCKFDSKNENLIKD